MKNFIEAKLNDKFEFTKSVNRAFEAMRFTITTESKKMALDYLTDVSSDCNQ